MHVRFFSAASRKLYDGSVYGCVLLGNSVCFSYDNGLFLMFSVRKVSLLNIGLVTCYVGCIMWSALNVNFINETIR